MTSAEEDGEAGSLALWRRDLRGTSAGTVAKRSLGSGGEGVSDSSGEAGPLGDKGETGPRGPGLTGECDLSLRSGGDGVNSPEDGGEGVPVI